jgi:MFS family permease
MAVVGQQVQSVALQWEIYSRTGSKLSLGWVGLVQALPVMLLALPAGHLADRFDRRRVIGAGLIGAIACSVGLSLLSRAGAPVSWMYVRLGLAATFQAIGNPARSSLLPQIVPHEAFANAVAWNSSFFHVASVAGPAIGGLVLLAGPPAAYLADAACATVFLVCVSLLTLRPIARSTEPATLRTLFAGVGFIFRTKVILATITLDLFAVLFGGAVYLLPVFAQDVLHVGPVGFGWLRAAPAIGALLAGVVIAHRPPMRRPGAAMLWSVAAFGAATIVFGLSRSYWLSLLMLGLTGMFDMVSVVVRHTLVQILPPDTMRGRVAAVNNVFISASNEIGGFESGVTAKLMGLIPSVVFGGIGTILVVAAVALKWPQVRRLGPLQDLRPMDAEPAPGRPVRPAAQGA